MRWWIKLIFGLLVIAAMLALAWALVRGATNILGNADLSGGAPDPMFAEATTLPTRPPEWDVEAPAPSHPTLDDYVPEVETPVDKTADELIREAEAARAAASAAP